MKKRRNVPALFCGLLSSGERFIGFNRIAFILYIKHLFYIEYLNI